MADRIDRIADWIDRNAGRGFAAIATLILMILALHLANVAGCSAPQQGEGEPVAVDWPEVHERLQGADYILRTYINELPPESDLKRDLNAFRTQYALPALSAVHAIAMNPGASDPAALVWLALDMAGKEVVPKLGAEDKEKAAAILAGVRAGLVLFGKLPAPEVTP